MLTKQQQKIVDSLSKSLDREGLVIIVADGDFQSTHFFSFDSDSDNTEEIGRAALYEVARSLVDMGYVRNQKGHPYSPIP